jgi:hypothetical protein
MKGYLCVFLVLAPDPLMAEPDSPAAFSAPRLATTSTGFLLSVPQVELISVPGYRPGSPGAVGILTTAIAFPLPARGNDDVSGALRKSFRYDPASYAGSGDVPASVYGAVTVLAPFEVRGNREREAAVAIDQAAWDAEAAKFHMVTGGLMKTFSVGPVTIDLGLWKHKNYGSGPGPPQFELDIIRINWW